MSETIQDNPQFTMGREGLKIPASVHILDVKYESQFMTFFRELWNLNGLSLPKDIYKQVVFNKPFERELVLPQADDKPLTVIRSRYEPKDKEEDQNDDTRSSSLLNQPKVVGEEKHEILVPPRGIGSFEKLFSLRHRHNHGTYTAGWREKDTYISWQGEGLSPGMNQNSEAIRKLGWQEQADKEEELFQRALGETMLKLIDALS